jgi:hypothetical protein
METCDDTSTVLANNNKQLLKISFSTPSGLLIVDNIDSNGNNRHICLLQHNIINLRPNYCKVKELKSVLTLKECNNIILNANNYCAINGGWTNHRHTNYSTTDIPLQMLYGDDNYIEDIVHNIIFPEFSTVYGLDKEFFHILGTNIYMYTYVSSFLLLSILLNISIYQ